MPFAVRTVSSVGLETVLDIPVSARFHVACEVSFSLFVDGVADIVDEAAFR